MRSWYSSWPAASRNCSAAAARPATAVIALAVAGTLLLTPLPGLAQQADDDAALRATLQTRLAYVITGNDEVDRISRAGLQGLTMFLAQRTALEAGDPVGVTPGRDELAFFPLIYWPMVPGAPRPSREALEQIDAFMKNGGTVLFDTRDAMTRRPAPARLRPGRRRCAPSWPRSTFRNWRRCRATTC